MITRRIIDLLETIDSRTYCQPLAIFNGSTLGQHFRHIFDFYHCLVRDSASGVIDYAARERRMAVENDPQIARQAFESLLDPLPALEEGKPLTVWGDFSHHPSVERPKYQSSVGRELMFAYDHALHHLAIIRMGLQLVFPQYCPEDDLGLSPATIKYRMAGRQDED